MPSRFSYQTVSESKETRSACPRPPHSEPLHNIEETQTPTSAISSSPSLPLPLFLSLSSSLYGLPSRGRIPRRSSRFCSLLLLAPTTYGILPDRETDLRPLFLRQFLSFLSVYSFAVPLPERSVHTFLCPKASLLHQIRSIVDQRLYPVPR